MNLFAHAVLAGSDRQHVAAGIVADRIKGVPGQAPFSLLPMPIQQGVIQHRAIDSYTDAHPLQATARALFGADSRRISGILLDLYGDFLLHGHWERWRTEPREQALRRARQSLQTVGPTLSLEAAQWASFILQHNLLTTCAQWGGLVDTAMRLGRRIGNTGAFTAGLQVIQQQSPQLDGLCLEFMDALFSAPELQAAPTLYS